ncbi:HD-GYP domain-containing protein [Thermodesulforhabdus norvegica]|uniref:HD domain-containing protein n=1 Tax=Thermodesulforhabdus norvegica TaxID=39841 RepID=A0A1I4TRK5_9BACT|nr:HD domain-containing phosphohydrolase [Thermodesulforhabdus norvegica]SFM79432.1 HD domain-containing protein [Thermodesulforhabdus norvegica]
MKTGTDKTLDVMNFIIEIARIIDDVSPEFKGHHLRVAYTALKIGTVLGIEEDRIRQIVAASCLHGIGCFTFQERLQALNPEIKTTLYRERAYAFLAQSGFLTPCAEVIGRRQNGKSCDTAYLSDIVELAERIDLLSHSYPGNAEANESLQKPGEALDYFLRSKASKDFPPETLSAAKEATEPEAFWFGLEYESPRLNGTHPITWIITWKDFQEFARILSEVIDWRSKFTVSHCASVRATALALAKEFGFTDDEISLISVAADLHDLGKLGIPLEILMKPDTLTPQEVHVMRKHAYLTYMALKELGEISPAHLWASQHHERLSGDGYPFRLQGSEISTEARIIAVSDVYTALTEVRPYRPAVGAADAASIVRDMAAEGKLCREVSDKLLRNLKTVEDARAEAIKETMERYKKWKELLNGETEE